MLVGSLFLNFEVHHSISTLGSISQAQNPPSRSKYEKTLFFIRAQGFVVVFTENHMKQ